jgi:hypothetical protein
MPGSVELTPRRRPRLPVAALVDSVADEAYLFGRECGRFAAIVVADERPAGGIRVKVDVLAARAGAEPAGDRYGDSA